MNSEEDFVMQVAPWKQGFGLQTSGAVRGIKGVQGEGRGEGTVSESDPLTDVQELKQPVAEIKTSYGGVCGFVIWVINVCGEQRAV